MRELTKSELHQINMEIEYGRISLIYRHGDNSSTNKDFWGMIHKCNKCGDEFGKISSIRVHYT